MKNSYIEKLSYQVQIYLVLVEVKHVVLPACSFGWVGSLEERLPQVAPIPMMKLFLDAKLMKVHPTEPETYQHLQ
jgi:hypothetical protein